MPNENFLVWSDLLGYYNMRMPTKWKCQPKLDKEQCPPDEEYQLNCENVRKRWTIKNISHMRIPMKHKPVMI